MQGIEFEEEKTYEGLRTRQPLEIIENKGPIMKLLGKVGVTDKTTANLMLLGFAAVLFGITIFLYAGAMGKGGASKAALDQMTAQVRMLRAADK